MKRRASVIDPVFRADSVVLAISVEKDGNLRVVYARIGRCQGRPAWRGAQAAVARPYPAVTCHVGVNGGRAPLPVMRNGPSVRRWAPSTHSSSGPTMKRCLISNEVSRW
jgi:hypothetical protein